MAGNDRIPTALRHSSEEWLDWLGGELARRGATPRSRLLILWDVLEEWFATDDFHASALAAATAGLRRDPGDPTFAAVAAHRLAVRRMLENLAEGSGVDDPVRLTAQLQVLVEGAIVGALVDREPGLARHARELTEIALDAGSG